jgi:CheY-like chemotaxis protein
MTGLYDYLYVEDDPLSREIMETLLLQVVGVKRLTILPTSESFIERLRGLEDKPDFIFLDIHVEPDDGYALIRMIRQEPDYTDVRVLAITASVMSDEVEALREAGFNGAFAKPLDMATFPELIQKLEAGEQVWQVS